MDCNDIPRIDYGKFSAALHRAALSGDAFLPVNGTLEVTNRCNLRCAHCYVPLAARQGKGAGDSGRRDGRLASELPAFAEAVSGRPELSSSEIYSLLDQISAEGCLWLLITGGEPLIRPDFLDIYGYAKQKGLLITLFTNATLMSQRIADYLAEYPPFLIEVSIYGATATTYDAVTGVVGSYDRAVRGIELLRTRGLPVRLKTMALRANVHELQQMERFADQRGLAFRWDHQVHPRLDGQRDPVDARLTPEEMVAADLSDPRRVEGLRDLMVRARDLRIGDKVFGCGAGLGSFHIDAFCFLQLCGFVRRYSYDLRRGSFRDGYYSYFPHVRSLRRPSGAICRSCELAAICTICVAWHDMEGDGREGPIEHIHQYAKLLAAALRPEMSVAAPGGNAKRR